MRQPRRTVAVHLTPALVPAEDLAGGVVVVIDVLRCTTTVVCALAHGCEAVVPVAGVEEARRTAASLAESLGRPPLLTGERDGATLPGFDLGNSPEEFAGGACLDRTVVCTTTNGTAAILHAAQAERVLLGAFVNFSVVCEELLAQDRPVHLLCAGRRGRVALEDTIFAGAVVDFLTDHDDWEPDDGARVAWDAFEQHGCVLLSAFELSATGRLLLDLGQDADLKAAADTDRFALLPEVQWGQPTRIVPAAVLPGLSRYRGETGLFA